MNVYVSEVIITVLGVWQQTKEGVKREENYREMSDGPADFKMWIDGEKYEHPVKRIEVRRLNKKN